MSNLANVIWATILVISVTLLTIYALKIPLVRKWIGHFSLNIALAGIFIYLFNSMELIDGLHIPINMVTLAVIAVLGLPGAVAIAALKWIVL